MTPIHILGEADLVGPVLFMGKAEPRPDRHLGAGDAVPAEEVLLAAEHVHRAALPLRVPAAPAGQLSHYSFRIHTGGQHMPMVAIPGDNGVALPDRRLHADHNRFLADVEMAESADEAHSVELPGLLLESPDQKHVTVVADQLVPVAGERIASPLSAFRLRSCRSRRLARSTGGPLRCGSRPRRHDLSPLCRIPADG